MVLVCGSVPFSGVRLALGVAVDSAGSVYVADGWGNGVLKLGGGGGDSLVFLPI